MKIYYSNIYSIKFEIGEIPQIGILISYYGLKKINKPVFCDSLFLDSGAYSAWSKGIEIDINDYIGFVKEYKQIIDIYASLDNITSYEDSLNNYYTMKDNGLNPLPTYHIGEPIWVLEKYMKETNYIALGGIAKRNKRERIHWLDYVFSKIDPNKAKFHGFGIQDRFIILNYPWKSVDSSSAHVMARFGGVCSPWGDFKINPKVNYKDLKWKTPVSEQKIKEWIQKQGFYYNKATENSTLGTKIRSIINIKYYEELAKQTPKKIKRKKQKGLLL